MQNKPSQDAQLDSAAREHYTPAHRSPMQTVTQWYKPTANAKRPYCGGRLSKTAFILWHLLAVFLLLLVVLVPIVYFQAVPAYLQYRIDHLGEDKGPTPVIHAISLAQMDNDGLRISIDAELEKLISFPINGGIGDMTVHVLSRDQLEILTVQVPAQSYWLNQPLILKMDIPIKFSEDNQQAMSNLIKEFSTGGLADYTVMARFNIPLYAFGIRFYSGLPLHKLIKVGNVLPNLASVKALMASVTKSSDNVSETDEKTPSTLGNELRARFNPVDVFNVTATFPVVLSKCDVKMTDEGAGASLGVSFENPLPIIINEIQETEIYISVANHAFLQILIGKISITKGLQDFQLDVSANFIAPLIDVTQTPKSIETATKGFAENGGFPMGIKGPISVKGARFISVITEFLDFDFSVKDTLESLKSSDGASSEPGILDNIFSESGVSSILGNSSITLQVLADKFTTTANMVLPPIIPIPRQMSFPYATTISIYGSNEKAIEIDVSPILISRIDSAIIANLTVVILPTNTESAATGLANSINPILAADPKTSSVGIKDLAFFTPGKPHFKWCDLIFAKEVISIGLPAICKECLISQKTASSLIKSSKPLTKLAVIRSVEIAQTIDRPGFSAKGTVDVAYPEGLPSLSVDIGFFHLDATVESTKILALELPTGLKFFPQAQGTNINGEAILNRDSELPSKVEKFANAILNDGTLPSFAGVTGLTMGSSPQTKLITFSKIVIDVNTASIVKIISSGATNTFDASSFISPGMIKIKNADFAIKTATEASLTIGTVILNPIPNLKFSIGTISLDAILEKQKLVSLEISPISLTSGESAGKLGLEMRLSDGSNGMDRNVATFATAFLNEDANLALLAGISSLKISPPGISSGPAVIDQFSFVKVQVASGKLIGLLNKPTETPSKGSPLDLSAIIPDGDILAQLNPVIKFVLLDAQPNGLLKIGGDAGYSNPLPISVKMPYLSINFVLAGRDAMNIEITGIELSRQAGTMHPRINILFQKDPSLPDNIAALLNNFLEGKINPSIGVKNIYFGTSSASRNGLLGAIDLDVSKLASPFADKGPEIRMKVLEMIDTILSSAAASKPEIASLAQDTSKPSIISIKGPMETQIDVNSADVSFLKSSVINAAIACSAKLPFNVDINLPYVSISAGFDDLKFLDLSISGLVMKGNGAHALSLLNSIAFNDVEQLADRIAVIVSSFMGKNPQTGNIKARQIVFGASSTDNINVISKLEAGINLEKILAVVAGGSGTGVSSQALDDILKKLGLTAGKLGLEALPAHTLKASAVAGFSNPFPLTLSGLGHIAVSSGIDAIDFVNVAIPGLSVAKGANSISTSINLEFPSSIVIQDKMQSFAQSISDNFGSTTEVLTVSQIGFGYSQNDFIRILSKSRLGIPSASILNQQNLAIVMGMGGDGGATSGLKATLKSANIDFHPTNIIDADIKANVQIPFDAVLNLPFFKAGTIIDEISFIDFELKGLAIAKGPNDLSLASAVEIHDTDSLAQKIEAITHAIAAGQFIPGKIGAGKLLMGLDYSPENVIDTFSKVTFSLSIAAVYMMVQSDPTLSIDLVPYIKSLALKVGGVKVETMPGKVIKSSLSAGFTNGFGITLNGLGYMTATSGVDAVPLAALTATGISLKTGENNINVGADLFFPSSTMIQDKLAEFVQHLFLLGPGKTVEKFTSSGIAFGYDDVHHFRFLSKALVGISSATVINANTIEFVKAQLGLSGNVTIDPMLLLKNLDVRKLHLDMSTALEASLGISLKNISFSPQAKIGYAALGTSLNGADLMKIHVVSGVEIKSINETISLDLANRIEIFDSESLQADVSKLVSQILAGSSVDGYGGAGGILFGIDQTPANVIDSFSKTFLNIKFNDIVPQLKSAAIDIYKSVMTSGPSSIGLDLKSATVDVHDPITLVSNIEALVTGIPGDIYINIPFVQTGVLWDQKDFVFTRINNILFKDSKFTTNALIGFTSKDNVAPQEIMDIIGAIAFHRPLNIQKSITIIEVGFGSSPAAAIKTFSKVSASLGVHDTLASTWQYVNSTRPVEIMDMQAKVMFNGVVVQTSMKPFGLPITVLAKQLMAKVTYRIDGKGEELMVINTVLDQFHLDDVKDPHLNIILLVDHIPAESLITSLVDVSALLLTGKDFSSNALLGYLKIVGSNDIVFIGLSESRFQAPDLYLWSPITANVLPNWPVSSEGIELMIKAGISFPNSGPLHVDAGRVEIDVTDRNKPIARISSEGDLIIRNSLEGGAADGGAGNPTHGAFHVIIPLRDMNPFVWFGIIQDLMNKPDEMTTKVRIIRDGKDVLWLENVILGLSRGGAMKKVLPVIGVVLGHLKVKVFSLNIAQTALYHSIVAMIEKWLNKNGISAAGLIAQSKLIGNETLPIGNSTHEIVARDFLFETNNFVIIGH